MATTSATRGRILAVDDDRAVTRILRAMLTLEGYEVEEVATGVGLADRIADDAPDLVLLDMNMPEKDGMDVLAELRARASQVPVIMLTGQEDRNEVAAKAIQQGAADYLLKPVSMDALHAAVRTALRVQRLRDEVAALKGLAETSGLLRAALDSAAGGVVLVDGDDVVVYANAAAVELLGVRFSLEGRPIEELFPPAALGTGSLRSQVQSAPDGRLAVSVPLADGTRVTMRAHAADVGPASGLVVELDAA